MHQEMRDQENGERLTVSNAFSLNSLSNVNNFETGINAALGLDYKIRKKNLDKFDFSVAQVINEKENKKNV